MGHVFDWSRQSAPGGWSYGTSQRIDARALVMHGAESLLRVRPPVGNDVLQRFLFAKHASAEQFTRACWSAHAIGCHLPALSHTQLARGVCNYD